MGKRGCEIFELEIWRLLRKKERIGGKKKVRGEEEQDCDGGWGVGGGGWGWGWGWGGLTRR